MDVDLSHICNEFENDAQYAFTVIYGKNGTGYLSCARSDARFALDFFAKYNIIMSVFMTPSQSERFGNIDISTMSDAHVGNLIRDMYILTTFALEYIQKLYGNMD